MNIRNLLVLGLFLIGILALSNVASAALPVTVNSVELDNDVISESSTTSIRSLDKGEQFEVKVTITPTANLNDVQIEAELFGYDHDDRVQDISDAFDVKNGSTYVKKLRLTFPQRIDQDRYQLRITVANRNDATVKTYNLEVETARHQVVIKDVVLSPDNGVVAGRALLATVRVQNYGKNAEDDVKVTFSVPDLGISASDYIDELDKDGDTDDQKSTEELYLRVPPCTKAGSYDAEVEVKFHDLEKVVRKGLSIEVLEDSTCEAAPAAPAGEPKAQKTVIAVGPESQDVTKGAGGVIYPITITNAGSARTYTVSVTGGDWGTFRVSPTNVITVGAGETQTVYLYAAANANAAEGTQVFGVSIKSGDSVVKEATLKANVKGGNDVSLRKALEVGLIVLVVILVILALIIGFNKLKGNGDGKEESQTYY